jgi:hypothetical protein
MYIAQNEYIYPGSFATPTYHECHDYVSETSKECWAVTRAYIFGWQEQ